ncbi:hypothetical protein LY78DRAFT_654893 [Colletotrichum sublineola]|nr:hypothetical protein LY78DRAFT_654893 [Colletotrichum sublineola]
MNSPMDVRQKDEMSWLRHLPLFSDPTTVARPRPTQFGKLLRSYAMPCSIHTKVFFTTTS